MKDTICIIDAYSTGANLPTRFKALGHKVIHIGTGHEAPELLSSFDETHIDIDWQLSASADVREASAFLRGESVKAIISGTETGIETADRLSHQLMLPGNSPETSHLRRNKTEMQSALRRAGILSIPSIKLSYADEAKHLVPFAIAPPWIVKPEASAGGDQVYVCHSLAQLEDATKKIIGATNQLGLVNESALVQKFIEGTQYFVNAISMNGSHRVTEIWKDLRTKTEEGRVVCDREILLPGEGALQAEIRSYVTSALTALGIHNGASHSEIKMTSDGPVLIEAAARMQGTIMPEAVEAALGYSHPSLVVDLVTRPLQWFYTLPETYKRLRHLNVVTLISRQEGVIINSNLTSLLETLPSYYGVIHTPNEGDYLKRTKDLFTNPGTIYLCSDNTDTIEADYRQIREWENEDAFFNVKT